MKAITRRFLYLLLAAVLCIVTVFCGEATLSAFADSTDSVQKNYENTNVSDNLKGSTIGGKEFDLTDYPHNSNGKPQIISFVEFCYSYYAEKQADYGLYVYVYNLSPVNATASPLKVTCSATPSSMRWDPPWWRRSFSATMLMIYLYNILMGFGTNVLLLSSAMSSVSDSIVEAAQLDGANNLQLFWHVVFPQIWRSIIPVNLLFAFLSALLILFCKTELLNLRQKHRVK